MSRAPFTGREKEIEALGRLFKKKSASLVTVQGRRRIGKSRLVEELAKKFGCKFYRFSGLPPRIGLTAQDQRDEFTRLLGEQCGFKALSSSDWGDLFTLLSTQAKDGKTLILLDEISWMASGDLTFLGKLKNAWDIHFSNNDKLILVLCGSVSSWIEKNILSDTGYVGRISYSLTLEELPLKDCNKLLNKLGTHYSAWEKFLVLAIMGGVPRYLEEINGSETAEKTICQLCFQKEGLLFREFENIFSDLFANRSPNYISILNALRDRSLSFSEICRALKIEKSSHVIEWLDDLVKSGFLNRDYTWNLRSSKESKLSHYRIKDNYIRFYLKYILPNEGRINKGHFNEYNLANLPGWSSVIGFQFENLVLSNRKWIIDKLYLRPEDIMNDNPYFQRKSKRQEGCQIDYMIQTRFNTLYVCEVKFSRNPLGLQVVSEVEEKIRRLTKPKNYSCNPVLIHINGVSDSVIDSGFFAHIIDLKDSFESIDNQ